MYIYEVKWVNIEMLTIEEWLKCQSINVAEVINIVECSNRDVSIFL